MNGNPWIVAWVRACGRRFAAGAVAGLITTSSALAVDETLVARYAPWFMPPEIWNPKLSPDGDYLGFQLRNGDNFAIGIYDFSNRKLSISGGSGKFYPVDYWWKGPRRLMVRIRRTSDVREHTVTAFDIDGRNSEELWHMNEHGGRIVDPLSSDPKHVLIAYSDEVARVNINNGKSTKVAGDIGHVRRWYFDTGLVPRAAYSRDYLGRQLLWWRGVGAGKWRNHEFDREERGPTPIAFDRNPRYLWVWDYGEYPNLRISKFDTENGETHPVFGGSGLHPTQVLVLGRTGEAIAAAYPQTDPQRVEALSAELRPAVARLAARFAGYSFGVVDARPDGRMWIVHAENSRFPGGYFTFDSESGEVAAIAGSHSGVLTEGLFVSSRPIELRSRSGGEIRGRLWMPRDVANPPLVVLCPPHFPAAPAPNRFDPYVQTLCDRGFAVAQFDARGTLGYGFETELLGTGDVAQVLREDYEDGVAGLAAQGLIDANRAVLMGVGMGGALAMAVGEGGDPFKAIIALNPPRKIERDDLVLLSIDSSVSAISGRVGGWRASAEAARAISPILVAPRLKIPTLVLIDEDRPGSIGRSADAKALTNAFRAAGLAKPYRADSKAFEKATKVSGEMFKVETAFKRHENLTPSADIGRESATIAVKIVEFLNEALSSGGTD